MNEKDHILIERFLNNRLTAEEIHSFKTRMNDDPDFRKAVLFEKQLHKTLDPNDWSFIENTEAAQVKEYESLFESNDAEKLKGIISDANTHYQQKSNQKSKKWIYYVAAAIILLLIAIPNIFDKSPSSEALYEAYLDTSELPSLTERDQENNMAEAQKLFNEKQYIEAITLFNKNSNSSENQATVQLYLGVSYMETGAFENAKKVFNDLINSDLLDAPKGYWFLALLHLKMDNTPEAKETLKKIVAAQSYNYEKAQLLLDEID